MIVFLRKALNWYTVYVVCYRNATTSALPETYTRVIAVCVYNITIHLLRDNKIRVVRFNVHRRGEKVEYI